MRLTTNVKIKLLNEHQIPISLSELLDQPFELVNGLDGFYLSSLPSKATQTIYSYWVEERRVWFNFRCLFWQGEPFMFVFYDSIDDQILDELEIDVEDYSLLETVIDTLLLALKQNALSYF